MNITPDQADRLDNNRTPGQWMVEAEDIDDSPTVNSLHCRGGLPTLTSITDNGYLEDGDAALIAAAPDLAQTIAGMTEEWGVERDRPCSAYIDGTVARWTAWIGDEARARKACAMLPRGGNPRLVRRLVGPVEVTE